LWYQQRQIAGYVVARDAETYFGTGMSDANWVGKRFRPWQRDDLVTCSLQQRDLTLPLLCVLGYRLVDMKQQGKNQQWQQQHAHKVDKPPETAVHIALPQQSQAGRLKHRFIA